MYWLTFPVVGGISGLLGAMALSVSPLIGTMIIGIGGLMLTWLVFMRKAFYHRARWTMIFTLWFTVAFVGSFLLLGLAAVSALVSPAAFVAVSLLYLAMFSLVLRYYLRQHSEAWESERRHNETKALDLRTASYDRRHPFRLGDFEAHPIEGALCRIVAPIAPLLGGAPMLLVQEGRGDGIWLFTAACGLSVGLIFSQGISNAWVYLRRIVHYERRLGRPIWNR